tara:strand:- start:769 stop:969 length:201 start_codon:yes stop_codon:yes gene_type:complete
LIFRIQQFYFHKVPVNLLNNKIGVLEQVIFTLILIATIVETESDLLFQYIIRAIDISNEKTIEIIL